MVVEVDLGGRRVLVINYEFPPIGGGAGTATLNLARYWAELGAHVTILTARFRDQPHTEEMHGFTVVRIPSLRRHADRSNVLEMFVFMLSALFHAGALARQTKAQVTIAFFGLPCGPISYILKVFRGIPYIISLRGGDVPGYLPASLSLYHNLTAPLSRIVWRSAAAIIANSKGLASLAERFAANREIGIIKNGVDTQIFRPSPARPESGSICILTVGRLHYQKAIDVLLRAFAAIVEPQRAQIRLVIVGDGPEKSSLLDLARQLSIAEQVDFLGWVDRTQLPELYRQADIFAFPSRDEGMPNAVLEAMASGLPVVATPVPGIEELVTSDETGLIVPMEDHASLAAALLRLATSESLRFSMGTAGREKVERHFSWKASAEAYLALVERTVATR